MKRYALLFAFVLVFASGYSQFLHFGVETFYLASQEISFFSFDESEFVYYFANEQNETIKFAGGSKESSKFTSSFPVFPQLFVKYEFKNNLYIDLDLFTYGFSNKIAYYNSVGFSTYVDAFNPTGNNTTREYNGLDIQWTFAGHSLNFGYVFLRTKALRPYVYGGFSSMLLMQYKRTEQSYSERTIRTQILFEALNTFERATFYGKIGAGLKYHGFTAEVSYTQNISALDRSDNPYYDGFSAIFITVGANLFSLNLTPANAKRKVKELNEL